MKELLDKAEVREMLAELPLPQPRSNRGYSPIDIIESFWVSVWLGGAKFAHTAYVRFDEVLREIFNWKRNKYSKAKQPQRLQNIPSFSKA